jgi:transglutaminase-like putative cysteine protease
LTAGSKLRVVHRTIYRYSEAVSTSHHEARLSPREYEHQSTVSHQIEIVPRPELRRRRFDYFGNRALHFALSEPHRSLEVTATSVVEMHPPPPGDPARTPPWEEVRDRLHHDRRRDVLDAREMTFDSPYVQASAELAAYAAPSFAPGQPVLAAVRDLTARIHRDFTYDPAATQVSTPLPRVLETRRGVCQDFAHLAVGCLRTVGLAGRYVSGYLLTRPPPGRPRLVGADASHAWIAAWVPHIGWVDFDPTNDVMPSDEHVAVAHGRDFGDVTPLRGVILGGGAHTLDVSVDVALVGEIGPAHEP